MHKSDIKDNILYIQSQEMLKKFLLFLKQSKVYNISPRQKSSQLITEHYNLKSFRQFINTLPKYHPKKMPRHISMTCTSLF